MTEAYLVELDVARHDRVQRDLCRVGQQFHQRQHPRHLLDEMAQLGPGLAGLFEARVEVVG
jgi:hypothetical protein